MWFYHLVSLQSILGREWLTAQRTRTDYRTADGQTRGGGVGWGNGGGCRLADSAMWWQGWNPAFPHATVAAEFFLCCMQSSQINCVPWKISLAWWEMPHRHQSLTDKRKSADKDGHKDSVALNTKSLIDKLCCQGHPSPNKFGQLNQTTRFGPNRVLADMEGNREFDFWEIH